MNYIHLTAKKKGLNQAQLNVLSREMYERILRESLKGSTGYLGKYYEPIVRHLLTAHGLTARDFHARENGSNQHIVEDGVLVIDGQRIKYEVKSGDGIIGWLEPSEDPAWSEDDILPDVDLIVYTCEVKNLTCEDDILDNSVVLTRSEFLQFISTEGPKRSQTVRTATKTATNDQHLRELNSKFNGKWRDCIIMQSAYRKARQAACESGNYLSLRSFLQEKGRA